MGVGEGRPGREEGRLAGSAPAGQPLWGSQCTAGPSPPERRQRELGQLAGKGLGTGTLFQFPLPPPGPVWASACQRAQGATQAGGGGGRGEAPGHGEAIRALPNRAKVPGRRSAPSISRPREPFLLSSVEYQLSLLWPLCSG